MIKEIYDFLLMLDQTGAAYLLFLLGFLLMADYCNRAQERAKKLRSALKDVQYWYDTDSSDDGLTEVMNVVDKALGE